MSLREAAIVWSYLAGVAEIEAKGLWVSLDKNSPCASKTRVLCVGSWATGFKGPPHHLHPALQEPPAADQCQGHSLLQEITSDTGRQRVAQICSLFISGHWMFQPQQLQEMTQPLPRLAQAPLCGPQELCLQLPTPQCWLPPSAIRRVAETIHSPSLGPSGQLPSTFVTVRTGPSLCLPPKSIHSLTRPGMACSCHRRSELQHKIRVQSAWHFCPLGMGSSGGPRVGCRNWQHTQAREWPSLLAPESVKEGGKERD